ncbi:hypothetical protein [Streptomyces sp. CB01580]|uniref:hypothetical protein n=1 Tax=Streptomyces sp. CB01580 TaxID=1703933 RepID=UPI00093CB75D|nr:hypothetical protein [Streptomyces sp. CB01580]OKJ28106.1 hypothetical protein AMK22_28760 [Streptomyces sp. CB01580]
MFSSSLSRKPAGLARTAAVTGIALAAFGFTAGTASAGTVPAERSALPQAGAGEDLPAHLVQRVCTELGAIVAQLPVSSAPAQVCKLVNGWD